MDDSSLERYKKEILINLSVTDQERSKLERDWLENPPEDRHPVFITVLVLSAIGLLFNKLIIFGVLVLFWAWSLRFDKVEYDRLNQNRKLSLLASAVATHVHNRYLSTLQSDLSSLQLKSLKDVSWETSYTVSFSRIDRHNFFFHSSTLVAARSGSLPFYNPNRAPHRSFGGNSNTAFNPAKKSFEVSPYVNVQFGEFLVTIKSDFRIVRKELSPEQVGWLFSSICRNIPCITTDCIVVDQYSATKNYSFDEHYLDSGEILRLDVNKAPKPTVLKLEDNRATRAPMKLPLTFEQAKEHSIRLTKPSKEETFDQAKSSPNRQIPPRQGAIGRSITKRKSVKTFVSPWSKRSPLQIAELLRRRKMIELIAMSAASRYERIHGRKPEDVSALNIGFDILSSDSNGETRRIEVKGLRGSGDVILTENELRVRNEHRESFYLYIVENCLSPNRRRIYVVRDFPVKQLEPQVTQFYIGLNEQNLHATIVVS